MLNLPSFSPAHPSVRRVLVLSLLLLGALLLCAARPALSLADACTPPVASAVACENTKTGTDPEIWQTTGGGDSDLLGFSTQMSVNKGSTVNFKIKSAVGSAYTINIYRLGYYQGNGARLIQGGVSHTGTGAQNPCQTNTTGLIDCGNWTTSASWTVPSTAVSGVYIAHLVRNDGDGDSQIIFVVRDDASTSKLLLQTSDATWQAYNTYGGNNLYDCTSNCPDGNPRAYKAAYKVSYNRPLTQPYDGVSSLFDGAEYSMIRFLERQGYDMSYTSSSDLGRAPALLLNHKVFISSGHDEYWSASQRSAVEAARAAGVSLAFFSGNEMFWKTRWEPSIDGTNTPNRTLVTYKDTHFDARVDPVEWTGSWYDPRFTTAGDGVTPQNAVTGQSFTVNAGTSSLTVPAAFGKLRLWRGTAAAALTGSQVLTLSPATLGYEWDVDADNGYRPAGQIKLSSTTASGLDVFTDYGTTVVSGGTATHNLTMYKTSSGARVFGAGTVQWAFGLDSPNPGGGVANLTMQQATLNLFADMGAFPITPSSGLSTPTATTDTSAPTATVGTTPTTVADGTSVTIAGTASDSLPGQVAGIEVTTDGGATWHPATSGTTSWSYTWIAHGSAAKIQARATDDSGNIGTATVAKNVAVTCPCSLFGTNVTPKTTEADGGDASPIEVGFKFQADTYGTIKGVRFYKAAANTGTHIGNLWSADGTKLASATFTGETASGWQTVTFSSPVQVSPNTTYVASYYAPAGHYSATDDYWYKNPAPGPNGGATADATPLHAVRSTTASTNGLYAYGGASSFPSNNVGAPNYWVDVVFEPTPVPNAVTGVSAVSGGKTSAVVSWTSPSTGGPITSYKITPYVGTTAKPSTTVAGTAALTSATVTGLTTGTTYTFTVTPSNPGGSAPESAKSNAVTPLVAVVPGPPGSVTADPASEQARVNWAAPATDGDSAITGYVVTPYVGATAGTPVSVGAAARTATLTGLADGVATTFKVAAVNGVGTGTGASSPAVTPGATLFDFSAPSIVDSGDPDAVELGVKFKADSTGTVSGLRFYKAATNTGTHVGTLWSSTGTVLARATFTDESASGWQEVAFSAPVSVTAGTTYVASYYAPLGHYSLTSHGFDNQFDHAPLHALGTSTSGNGVFVYAGAPTFPTGTYGASNYFVDVLYAVAKPGTPTAASAVAGNGQATVSWTAPSSGGTPTSYLVTPYIGATAQTPTTVNSATATSAVVTGLTAGTSYTFKVQAVNSAGAGTASAATNAVTPTSATAPLAPGSVAARPADSSVRLTWTAPTDGGSPLSKYTVTPYIGGVAQTPTDVNAPATGTTVTGLSDGTAYTFKVTATNAIGTSPASAETAAVTPQETIFGFATPGTVDSGDGSGIELGVKFKSSIHGAVTGIRFYKADTNTGTHVGSLWSQFGTRLATATFTGESASGWQTVTFSAPVTITPDTTYVASYYTPSGHYSVNGPGLASAISDTPLTALADSTSSNGVYAYGSSSGFPSSSYNASNYWVDVLYAPLADPGPATSVSATAGPAAATVSWTAPSGGTPVDTYKITPFVGSTAQASTTINAPATSATILGLTPGTSYTFKVQPRNVDGSGPTSAASNAVTPTSNSAPGAPTGVAATPASSSARVTWTAPGGVAVTGFTVTPYAGTTAGTPVTASGSATSAVVTGLTNGTAYTFKVVAGNGAGDGPASAASDPVTPAATIFDFATPSTIDGGDTSSVVLGAKLTSDSDGWITGIRFYKAAANTGTHVGGLYSAGGTLLAQATFAGETDSGWQTAYFASPQAVTAGTTYIATYLAPNGHYSLTGAAFASGAVDNPPLHAVSDSVSPNGVYAYSGSLTFPASNFNATNYFVDVLFSSSGS